MSGVLKTMNVLNENAKLISLDFKEASSFMEVNPCPSAIPIEELKKWMIKLGESGPEFVIIKNIPELNDLEKLYAVAYDKGLCAYWIISNDQEFINNVIKTLENGGSMPEAIGDFS